MSNRLRWTLAGIGFAVITAAVVAVVLVLVLSGDSELIPADAEITIEEIINLVETERPRGADNVSPGFLPSVVGQNLIPGDVVKTQQNSEARVDLVILEFRRVTRTTPNTLWRLGQFALDQGAIVELEQGKIFLLDGGFREGRRPVRIVTPAGTASPWGTWLSAEYDPQTGVAELQCFRGACALANDLGVQYLRTIKRARQPLIRPQLRPNA